MWQCQGLRLYHNFQDRQKLDKEGKNTNQWKKELPYTQQMKNTGNNKSSNNKNMIDVKHQGNC